MKPNQRTEHIPEHQLTRLWRNRDWRRRSLALTGGRRLRVLYPGRPASGPGPDFRDALLQIQGSRPVFGDVEVHRESRGWREHGHHRDPRYNRVLLHVVARTPGGEHSSRHDGEEVPVVGLMEDNQELEEVLHTTDAAGLSLPLLQRGAPWQPSAYAGSWTKPDGSGSQRRAHDFRHCFTRRTRSRSCTAGLWRPWATAKTGNRSWSWPTAFPGRW